MFTVVLVITLHVSVTNFIKSRAQDRRLHGVMGVGSKEEKTKPVYLGQDEYIPAFTARIAVEVVFYKALRARNCVVCLSISCYYNARPQASLRIRSWCYTLLPAGAIVYAFRC